VAPHQDELRLSSSILEDGGWNTYQQGTLAFIRPLAALMDGIFDQPPEDGVFLSCGTLPALPNRAGVGIRPASAMQLTLLDPRHRRAISHSYETQPLPIIA